MFILIAQGIPASSAAQSPDQMELQGHWRNRNTQGIPLPLALSAIFYPCHQFFSVSTEATATEK